MAPVDAHEMQGAFGTVTSEQAAGSSQEIRKLGVSHFTISRREILVLNCSEPGGIPRNGDVTRQIGEDHDRAPAFHQCRVAALVERIPAAESMTPKQPQIAGTADLNRFLDFGQRIGRITPALSSGCNPFNHYVNLAEFKSGDIEAKLQLDFRKCLQLLGEQAIVPEGVLGQPVVCDHERLDLGFGQVFETDRWNFVDAEYLARLYATVAGNYLQIAIY